MTEDYKIELDLKAIWIKIPRYRIWTDGELMLERTYWPDPDQFYITENMIVSLNQGKHEIILERIDPNEGKVWVEKARLTNLNKNISHVISLGPPLYLERQKIDFTT